MRYFTLQQGTTTDRPDTKLLDKRTEEDTIEPEPSSATSEARYPRNYDEWAASEIPGQLFFNREYPQFSYSRRLNTRLAVARTAFFDMTGPKRDAFYEKQLLHNLAWYCPFPPQLSDSPDDSTEQTWTFWCDVPEHPDTPLELVVRAGNPTVDNVATTFERICVQYETAFAPYALSLIHI